MLGIKTSLIVLAALLATIFLQQKTSHVTKPSHATPKPSQSRQTTSPTPNPTKTTTPNNSPYVYPNAKVLSQVNGTTTLTSTDDPNRITNWYQDAFSRNNMRSIAVSMSSTNNTVDNKLAGDNGTQHVEVSMHKNATESTTTITLIISSSTSGDVHIESNTSDNTKNLPIY